MKRTRKEDIDYGKPSADGIYNVMDEIKSTLGIVAGQVEQSKYRGTIEKISPGLLDGLQKAVGFKSKIPKKQHPV